ncbi:MAG: hypothetical protein ACYSUN_07805, partial [Planctomycetota bacterium]
MGRQDRLWKSPSLKKSLLRHDAALVLTGAGWVVLLVWQIMLVFSADRVRGEVASREAWLTRAESVHEDINFASSRLVRALRLGGSAPTVPRELHAELAREGLLVALPSEGADVGAARKHWSTAARALVDEL